MIILLCLVSDEGGEWVVEKSGEEDDVSGSHHDVYIGII